MRHIVTNIDENPETGLYPAGWYDIIQGTTGDGEDFVRMIKLSWSIAKPHPNSFENHSYIPNPFLIDNDGLLVEVPDEPAFRPGE